MTKVIDWQNSALKLVALKETVGLLFHILFCCVFEGKICRGESVKRIPSIL